MPVGRERRVDRYLVGAVAVEQARCGEREILAVHDRDRDPRAVGRGRPVRDSVRVARRVEVAQNRLLFEQCLLALVERDLQDARRGHHRRAAEAQRGDVGLGVRPEPGRRGALGRGDDPARLEQVGRRTDLRSRAGGGHEPGSGPRRARSARGRRANASTSSTRTPGRCGTTSRHDGPAPTSGAARTRKSLASSLVSTTNQPGRARGGREVVDGVLDPLTPGQHHRGLGERRRRGDRRHSVVLVLCRPISTKAVSRVEPVPRREPAVGLLEDEHVAGRVAAEAVAPELEGPLRLIEADVEDVVGGGRPGQAVAGLGHRLGGRRARCPASSGRKRSSYLSLPSRSVA